MRHVVSLCVNKILTYYMIRNLFLLYGYLLQLAVELTSFVIFTSTGISMELLYGIVFSPNFMYEKLKSYPRV